LLVAGVLGTASASADVLVGDLNGDGTVGLADYGLIGGLVGSETGDPDFDPAADFDGSGNIGLSDFALVLANVGLAGGDPDTTPPWLFLTLNDIPAEMNGLLVVPPDGFAITLEIDGMGGSLIDTGSLVVTSSQDIGPHPAGTNLAPLFTVNPVRASWQIPPGSDLARATHSLEVSLRDLAGNVASTTYAFAVRDFEVGPPLGNPQTVFLDFDQDRNLGPELDFLESLREFGLSSPALVASGGEMEIRDEIVALILQEVRLLYGRNADGSPGPDAVNIAFTSTAPQTPHSRLCVGGQSPQGAPYLGAATLDENNVVENSNECATAALFGVFPHAIDDLWGAYPGYLATFGPLDPGLGGVPLGEHPLDAQILAPGFDPMTASPAAMQRFFAILIAGDAFIRIVATAIAHEVGHMLGLVAHGPAPGGLWGGSSGASMDHNVAPAGGAPAENFIMNSGDQFTFNEITGRGGVPKPAFRPLNWAYLHDRVALNHDVTALLPPPALQGVSPGLLVFTATSPENQLVTLSGQDLAGPASIELVDPGSPVPLPLFGVSVVDPQTATAFVNRYFTAPGVYDVRWVNGDGQVTVLEEALEIVFQ
jgi:hypothetical protein